MTSKEQLQAFFSAIDDTTSEFDFRFIKSHSRTTPPIKKRLTVPDCFDELTSLNQQGYNVYFTVNETNGSGVKACDITSLRACYLDFDDDKADNLQVIEDMPLSPSIVVQSSPNKYQAYWIIVDMPLDEVRFKDIHGQLIKRYKADPSCNDIARVLRVPCFHNTKYKEKPLSKLISVTDDVYTFDEFLTGFEINLDNLAKRGGLVGLVGSISSNNEKFFNRAELITSIITGENLHDSTRNLIASLSAEMNANDVIAQVQAYMQLTQAPRDERYQERFYDIPRMVHEWYKKAGIVDADSLSWEPIKPLNYEPLPVDKLTSDMLPQCFSDYASDIADRNESLPDYAAVGLYIAAAGAVGRKIKVQPKRNNSNFVVTPNLFGVIIGRPSTRKSPNITEAIKTIERLQKEALEQYANDMREYENLKEFAKLSEQATKEKVKALLKKDGNEEKAKALLAKTSEPEPPAPKRYISNDSTIEALTEILQHNKNGLIIYRDELAGFLSGLDKKGCEQARSFYLEGWAGDARFTTDRVLRGTTTCKVTISLIGTTQPAKLSPYVKSAVKADSNDDGFLQRFQLMVYPDAPQGVGYVDKTPNKLVEQAFQNKVRQLVEWQPSDINMQGNTGNVEGLLSDCHVLRFDDDAQTLYKSWYEANKQQVEQDLHPALQSHFTKYASLVPSLALLNELVDSDCISNIKAVSSKATRKAIAYTEYLKSHAFRVYSMATDKDVENADTLIKRLHKLGNPFTASDITRKNWTGFDDKEDINNALSYLIEHNYIQTVEERKQAGGRPSKKFYINPEIKPTKPLAA